MQQPPLDGAGGAPLLARVLRILDEFGNAFAADGVVGEERAGRLLYLCLTTRFLPRPVSAIVKGPSAAGKSELVKHVLRFFPLSAYYELTAMSERALAYFAESMEHRFLVLYEAAGVQGGQAAYLVRSLMSEGKIRYATVVKAETGEFEPRMIERAGPTGLLTTTTAHSIHAENETRLLSIPITDSAEQTRKILREQARRAASSGVSPVDLRRWTIFQQWLIVAEHRVTIPYAEGLADCIPPVAVRLRRDFPALLALIEAHAILHQMTRSRDSDGRIIATLDDYAEVRGLVADLVAEGAEASVPKTIRETVEAVRQLRDEGRRTTVTNVARALNLDKSSAWRRVSAAIEQGYLRNDEGRPGRPAKLRLGRSLPKDIEVFPRPEVLRRCMEPRNLETLGNIEPF
jgi:hypothetical protein